MPKESPESYKVFRVSHGRSAGRFVLRHRHAGFRNWRNSGIEWETKEQVISLFERMMPNSSQAWVPLLKDAPVGQAVILPSMANGCRYCGDPLFRFNGDWCADKRGNPTFCPMGPIDTKNPTARFHAPRDLSWHAAVKTAGDEDWVYNGMRFATKEEADAYAKDLAWRWTAVLGVEVSQTVGLANYKWADGKAVALVEGGAR